MDMGEAKRALELKKIAFEADPDRFIDRNDLVMAAIRTEQDGKTLGWDYVISRKIGVSAYKMIIFDLTRLINRIIDIKEVQDEAQAASKIIVPDVKIDS